MFRKNFVPLRQIFCMIMNKYINPFIDWSFKRIFGTENVKDILIGFLNAVLEGEQVITDIQYLNNELKPEKGGM